MRFSLVNKDQVFFDLFAEAGENSLRAAKLLQDMIASWPESADLAREILLAEHEGDRITHDISQRTSSTFVTPIDAEDIQNLASRVDDVVDHIEEATDLLELYGIESPTRQSIEQARILTAAVGHLSAALGGLKAQRGVQDELIKLKELEDEGDRVVRDAIADLFRDERIDPLTVIRWKDIFEALEDALDACETAANVVGNIVVKNA